jgi:hypothetical protein
MNSIDVSPTKTIVIGVMFTNLVIERGHQLVLYFSTGIEHKLYRIFDSEPFPGHGPVAAYDWC